MQIFDPLDMVGPVFTSLSLLLVARLANTELLSIPTHSDSSNYLSCEDARQARAREVTDTGQRAHKFSIESQG